MRAVDLGDARAAPPGRPGGRRARGSQSPRRSGRYRHGRTRRSASQPPDRVVRGSSPRCQTHRRPRGGSWARRCRCKSGRARVHRRCRTSRRSRPTWRWRSGWGTQPPWSSQPGRDSPAWIRTRWPAGRRHPGGPSVVPPWRPPGGPRCHLAPRSHAYARCRDRSTEIGPDVSRRRAQGLGTRCHPREVPVMPVQLRLKITGRAPTRPSSRRAVVIGAVLTATTLSARCGRCRCRQRRARAELWRAHSGRRGRGGVHASFTTR